MGISTRESLKPNGTYITLFGSNSGNNLGDAAILSSILWNFKNTGYKFLVPTPRPKFVDLYSKWENVIPVDIHPLRTLSIRFLGLPTIAALTRSKYTFICDGILFGKRLLDPSFNFLSVIFTMLPALKLTRNELICFACGIGPFNSSLSRIMARKVLEYCSLLLLRDDDSVSLALDLTAGSVSGRVIRVSDPAFLNPMSPPEVGEGLLRSIGLGSLENVVGFNVTKYLGSWVGSTISEAEFIKIMVAELKQFKTKTGCEIVFFSTHPMDNDINRTISTMVGGFYVPGGKFLSHDIMSAMSLLKLFCGMRFHSLVLAAASGAPIFGVKYAPKVGSLLKILSSTDCLVEMNELSALGEALVSAVENSDKIKERQQCLVEQEKAHSMKAFEVVINHIQNASSMTRESLSAGM